MIHRRYLQRVSRSRRRGLSLVEVAIATLLVGVLAVASLRATGNVYQTWDATADMSRANLLAEHLLSEILSYSYEDPEDEAPLFGRESDEAQSPSNRLEFDDTDDFDNWSDSPPRNRDGSTLAGFNGWTRVIDVKKVNPATYANLADGATDTGLRKITVTVTDPDGVSFSRSVLRSNVGMLQEPLGADTTIINWVGVTLQRESTSSSAAAGTALLNYATDQ